MTIFKII